MLKIADDISQDLWALPCVDIKCHTYLQTQQMPHDNISKQGALSVGKCVSKALDYSRMTSWHKHVYHHDWPFVKGITQSLVDSPHKGPVKGSFNIFLVVSMKKTVEKQLYCQWKWCSCDVTLMHGHSHHINIGSLQPLSIIQVMCSTCIIMHYVNGQQH